MFPPAFIFTPTWKKHLSRQLSTGLGSALDLDRWSLIPGALIRDGVCAWSGGLDGGRNGPRAVPSAITAIRRPRSAFSSADLLPQSDQCQISEFYSTAASDAKAPQSPNWLRRASADRKKWYFPPESTVNGLSLQFSNCSDCTRRFVVKLLRVDLESGLFLLHVLATEVYCEGVQRGVLLCFTDQMDLTEFIPGVTVWVCFLTKS